MCASSDAYIVAKRRINVRATANTDIEQNNVAFRIKDQAPFRSCKKINSTLIENEKDLYMVMPMYNLLKYI